MLFTMKKPRKVTQKMALCSLLLAFSVGLSGCSALDDVLSSVIGPKQEKASNAVEAAEHFLTDLQSGNFEAAMSYMYDDNELLHVLPAAAGESVPEMDAAYKKFCEQLKDITFTVTEAENRFISWADITVQTRNYGSAIRYAMAEALYYQCVEGGDAFCNVGSWLENGIDYAEMTVEGTETVTMSARNGRYYIENSGYHDLTVLDLITGGFYEYANLTMTTCERVDEYGILYEYYVAAVGDEIIGYLTKTTEPYDTSVFTEEDIAELQAYYDELNFSQEGIYMGFEILDGAYVSLMGIDFYTASQTALVNAGIVSGRYKTMGTEYLSLRSTIKGFTEDGFTCVTMPQYDE